MKHSRKHTQSIAEHQGQGIGLFLTKFSLSSKSGVVFSSVIIFGAYYSVIYEDHIQLMLQNFVAKFFHA